jgi:hypothetical protein
VVGNIHMAMVELVPELVPVAVLLVAVLPVCDWW